MEYLEFIGLKKEIYEIFLCFIDEENNIDEHFHNIVNIIKIHGCQQDREEFKSILHLIREINRNHHRLSSHLSKMERFFSYYEEYIKQTFSNDELLNLYFKNPQILHLLINKNIVSVDKSFLNLMDKDIDSTFVFRQYQGEIQPNIKLEKNKFYMKEKRFDNYMNYFFFDLKPILSNENVMWIEKTLLDMNKNIFNDFEKKCQIGENDSYICQLIREDLIEEFIAYINKENISLNSEIKPSIFETNAFLNSKKVTLIEYAAFFGSIQIFQYLQRNNVELTPSLWMYAIHGNSPDIIQILEDNRIEPSDKTFKTCLKESIKCHHNGIAKYIQNNLMNETIEINESNFKNNPISYGFHFYNYEFIQDCQNLQFSFFYACLYDNFPIVKYLIEKEKVDLNQTIIHYLLFHKAKIYIFILNI